MHILYKYKSPNKKMRTPVIIKSVDSFSFVIKMKLCFNLKDTMYKFSYLFAFTRTKVGVGEKKEMTCSCFPLGEISKS